MVLVHSSVAGNLTDYAKDPTLAPIVSSYKQRQVDYSLLQLDAVTESNPDHLDAYRMGMIVGTSFDRYDAIFDNADELLKRQPNDPQALYFKAIYTKGLGEKGYGEVYRSMEKTSPKVASRMDAVVKAVDDIWSKPVHKATPDIDSKGLGILALGSPANPDGTPQPRLLNTLTRTLQLANDFPEAPIFVTGGAVYTSMTESQAMKNWLVEKGVNADRIIMEDQARDTVGNAINIMPYLKEKDLDRLLLVTVEYHLRRSSLIIDGVLQQQDVDVDIVGIAGESDLAGNAFDQRMVIEKAASYRDRGRAFGLYEHDDFLALETISR